MGQTICFMLDTDTSGDVDVIFTQGFNSAGNTTTTLTSVGENTCFKAMTHSGGTRIWILTSNDGGSLSG